MRALSVGIVRASHDSRNNAAVRGLGVWGIATMLMFLAIPRLGLIYAYRERILEWQ